MIELESFSLASRLADVRCAGGYAEALECLAPEAAVCRNAAGSPGEPGMFSHSMLLGKVVSCADNRVNYLSVTRGDGEHRSLDLLRHRGHVGVVQRVKAGSRALQPSLSVRPAASVLRTRASPLDGCRWRNSRNCSAVTMLLRSLRCVRLSCSGTDLVPRPVRPPFRASMPSRSAPRSKPTPFPAFRRLFRNERTDPPQPVDPMHTRVYNDLPYPPASGPV